MYRVVVVLCVLLVAVSSAFGAPTRLVQQGQLLDSTGSPLTGSPGLVFSLHDAATGGNEVWREERVVAVDGGVYSVVLGTQVSLDDSLFATGSLWMQVTVGGDVLSPRQEIVSVPHALRSAVAERVEGGPVDTSELSVDGSLVIDDQGNWLGTPPDWTDLTGVPSELSDGDGDLLSSLTCSDGQVAKWDVDLAAWDCSDDTSFDSLAFLALSCLDGQVPHYSLADDQWYCEADQDTQITTLDWAAITGIPADIADGDQDTQTTTLDWAAITGIPADIADGDQDTQTVTLPWSSITDVPAEIADGTDAVLSEIQVENYIANGPLDLPTTVTVNGNAILTAADPTIQSIQCQPGEVLSSTATGWVCTSFQALLDADSDGILAWNDCDDGDNNQGSNANDQDCDGTATSLDCDDSSPTSTIVAEDGDCDGTLTAQDCDDDNALSTILAEDADCDGAVTALDCDDSEPSAYPGASEVCGDGIDNNCADGADENCTSCSGSSTWSIDGSWTQDNDSYRSGQLPGSQYNATNTLDGIGSSFWLSNDGDITDQWLVYNLGSAQQVQGVRLSNGQSPYSVRNATLQISSSLSGPWTDTLDFMATTQDGGWQTFSGFLADSQFFRLYFHDNYGSTNYMKVRDVEFDVCF